MAFYYVRMYRNRFCGGYISFIQAWIFLIFMFLFASLLTSVAHYLYFQFIDHGYIVNTYIKMLNDTINTQQSAMEAYREPLQQITDLIGSMTPIDITMQLLSQNVFYGSILAIPIALFVMKRDKTGNSLRA